MSDIKLFCIKDNGVAELEGRSMALERNLQTLMERNLEALLGVRFLASEHFTGHKQSGRIDTLGLDENGCPVIIEYKRSSNENVINQGLFYLDWLMDHKADFQLLVQKALGQETAEAIEWDNPRLLCIAGDFTRYDEHAVQQINRNIELIRYRHYPDGFLVLEMVNATTASPTQESISLTSAGSASMKKPHTHQYKTVSEYFKQSPPHIKDIYHALEDYLLALGDDVTVKTLKFYFAFKRLKNFACVEVRSATPSLLVYVKVPSPSEVEETGFSRDVSKLGHFGTGNLEITIRNMDDLERAKPLLQQSYERS